MSTSPVSEPTITPPQPWNYEQKKELQGLLREFTQRHFSQLHSFVASVQHHPNICADNLSYFHSHILHALLKNCIDKRCAPSPDTLNLAIHIATQQKISAEYAYQLLDLYLGLNVHERLSHRMPRILEFTGQLVQKIEKQPHFSVLLSLICGGVEGIPKLLPQS